jgi:hypothetical protein
MKNLHLMFTKSVKVGFVILIIDHFNRILVEDLFHSALLTFMNSFKRFLFRSLGAPHIED